MLLRRAVAGSSSSFSASAVAGAVSYGKAGIATAIALAFVDYLDVVSGTYAGNRWILAPYLLALQVLLLGTLAAGLGFWISGCLRLTESLRAPLRTWARAALISCPWALLFAYVPSSWIDEHYTELGPKARVVALAIRPLLIVATISGAWVLARLLSSQLSPALKARLDQRLALLAFVLAAICYGLDRTLYVGLYEDFHLGLAALSVSATFFGVVLIQRARETNGDANAVLRLASDRVWAAALPLSFAVIALGEIAQPNIFGPSRSLVFAKMLDIARAVTDFDDDGASNLLGGLDCAAFNPQIAPGNFDMPGNQVDEDCSGTSAVWPHTLTAKKYATPELREHNVLLISIDALRADHLGVYGYARNTSPNIDALAAHSLRFARAYSAAPKTNGAIPSLLTGLYPSNLTRNYDDVGIHDFLKKHASKKGHKAPKRGNSMWYRLGDDIELFSELGKRHGYTTGALTATLHIELLGLGQGFDQVETTKSLTRAGQDFLQQAAASKKPFFLWLHYSAPHLPYDKHDKFPFGDEAVDRYDSEIASDDEQVGVLLQALREAQLDDKTIIALTADHGEEFGDHGGKGHGQKLYRELLHVPLLLRVPGMAPGVVDTPVELVDLVPTFCEILKLGDCLGYDGQSLFAAVAGQRELGRGAYAEIFHGPGKAHRRSLFDGRWRLIEDFKRDRIELYDTSTDPNETTDVSSEHPDVVQKLMDNIATRSLARQGQLFERYEQTRDTSILVRELPRLKQEELIKFVLDELERHPDPRAKKQLKQLARRKDLGTAVRKRVQALAGGK